MPANERDATYSTHALNAYQIYVEVERARLTHRLAQIKETEGDTAAAASVMMELQVETYGSMSRREKASLILEQMRLCLAKQDFMRTQIIAKKINVKFFTDENDEETQALKLKYYEYAHTLSPRNQVARKRVTRSR